MKAMMDKPHLIRFDDKLVDDNCLEQRHHRQPRARTNQMQKGNFFATYALIGGVIGGIVGLLMGNWKLWTVGGLVLGAIIAIASAMSRDED